MMAPNADRQTCVVMTLCNRPAYTRRVLTALSRCEEVENFPIRLHCEPINPEVIAIARDFAGQRHLNAKVFVGSSRVGCNLNTYLALADGFDEHEQVIALEDDTLPGRDFLRFAAWGLATYAMDPSVFSICGYQRTPESETGHRHAVIRESWFTPWGWATWRDRWEDIRHAWPADDSVLSFDTLIDKRTRRGRHEVRPLLARIQNIGAEGGVHVPNAEWHQEHHFNPHWIESVPGEKVDHWQEVDPTITTALRVHHPC